MIEWKICDKDDYFYGVAGPGGGSQYYLNTNQEYQYKLNSSSEIILNYYKQFAQEKTFDNGSNVILKFVSTGTDQYYNLVCMDGSKTYILDEFHIYYKITNYWPDMSVINVVAIDDYIIDYLAVVEFVYEGEEISPTLPDLPKTEEEQQRLDNIEKIEKYTALYGEYVIKRNSLVRSVEERIKTREILKENLSVVRNENFINIDLDGISVKVFDYCFTKILVQDDKSREMIFVGYDGRDSS